MSKDNTTATIQRSEKSPQSEAQGCVLDNGVRMYLDAVDFAHQAHAGQRYGTLPYVRHLAHVESVLHRFGYHDFDLMAAAWLHDIVEDTAYNGMAIQEVFGDEIAYIVYCVTDGEGKNRKERKRATYPKLRTSQKAVVIKLADRIANIESCLHSGQFGLLAMYRKEHEEFKYELRSGVPSPMWPYLKDLLASD